jgi:ribosomal-protein-alanine N-acetyltransferase
VRFRPPDPLLAVSGILLRPFSEDDVPAIAEACRDPEIPRWTHVPDGYTEHDARAFVALSKGWWAEGSNATFAITDVASSDLLGSIGLHDVVWPVARVGYWVKPEARGYGVAPQALRLVSRWALLDAGVERLELLAQPENVASRRVAEKVGFVREGVLRSFQELKGSRRDYVMFSLLPGDL